MYKERGEQQSMELPLLALTNHWLSRGPLAFPLEAPVG